MITPYPIILDIMPLVALLKKPKSLAAPPSPYEEDYTILVPKFNSYRGCWRGAGNGAIKVKYATNGRSKPAAFKDALQDIKTKYTVIMDADTYTPFNLRGAIRVMEKEQAHVSSTVVLPVKRGVLSRLQEIEYRLAMNIRRLYPQLTSGACIITKTASLRVILDHHSGGYWGEDIEIGLVAKKMGMKVIHTNFHVWTEVPNDLPTLMNQRYNWTTGFLRLQRYFRYFALPSLYGLLVFLAATPLKLYATMDLPTDLVFPLLYLSYVGMTLAGTNIRNRYILIYPFYSFFMMLMVPIYSFLQALVNVALGKKVFI